MELSEDGKKEVGLRTSWSRSDRLTLSRSFFKLDEPGTTLVVVLLTTLGAALRAIHLGTWGFSGDEIRTLIWLQNRVPLDDHGWSVTKYLSSLAVRFIGSTELAARLVPASIGILSIPIIYLLTRKLWGTYVALMTGLQLTVSTWHIFFSQTSRFYTSMLLLYTMAVLLFIDGLLNSRFWRIVLALGLWGLAVTEQLSALLFLPTIVAFLIYSVYAKRGNGPAFRPRLWMGLSLILLLILVFLGLPYLRNTDQFVREFGPYLEHSNSPIFLTGCAIYYIGVTTVVIGLMTAIYLLITSKEKGGMYVAIAAILPVIVVSAGGSLFWLGCRHQFVSLVFWMVLASIGVRTMWNRAPDARNHLAIGALSIIVAYSAVSSGLYYLVQNGNRENAKSAFNYIALRAEPGDQIIVPERQLAEYYLRRPVTPMRPNMDLPTDISACRVWIVEDQFSADRYRSVIQWVEENAQLVVVEDVQVSVKLYKMRVYLFEGAC